MRIARGLFRLWLVASVVWVIAIGLAMWSRYPYYGPWEGFEHQWLSQAESSRLSDIFPQGVSQATVSRVSDDELKEALSLFQRAAIRGGVVVAFIPPALTLVLGSALVWAFRGFRPR